MHRFAHLRAFWLLLTLGTFLAGFSAGASAQWVEENRARIATAPSFLASLAFYHSNGNVANVIGNATLIDSEWALTNRHVLWADGQFVDRRDLRLYVPACKATHQISDVRLFSKDNSRRDDLALIKLAKATCSRAAPARLRILSQGEIDELYRDKNRIVITAIYGKWMAISSSWNEEIGSNELIPLEARCTARGIPEPASLLYYCVTAGGTSGAPIVSSFSNGTFVIGLNSFRTPSGMSGGILLSRDSVTWMKEQTKLRLFLFE